jgi:hypothetical protein
MHTRTKIGEGKYLPCEVDGGTVPPLVFSRACRMTQLDQSVVQESVKLRPAEFRIPTYSSGNETARTYHFCVGQVDIIRT